MNRTVFILGAGASAEAGAPTMASFVKVAEGLARQKQVGSAQADFDLFLQARSELLNVFAKCSLDLNNIEELFAAFEIAELLGRLGDFPSKDIPALTASMRRVIATTIERSMRFGANDKGQLLAPSTYRAFVHFLKYLRDKFSWPITLVTFNYDLALDYALVSEAEGVDYGFESIDSTTSRIELLKLHGSLNWLKHDDHLRVAELSPKSATPGPENGARHVGVNDLLATPDDFREIDPVIVPPTWNKGRHYRDFAALWRRAGERLASAENIVVIGYSAPHSDQFYRHLYAIGTISKTILRKYLCIGPNVASNHKNMIGGAAKSHQVFHNTDALFSSCYEWLMTQLEIDNPSKSLFSSEHSIAEGFAALARNGLDPKKSIFSSRKAG